MYHQIISHRFNLVTGETAIIHAEDEEIEIKSIMIDYLPQKTFAELLKAKAQYIQTNMPLNFLFCGIPNVYFFIHVQFDQSKAHLLHIPTNTSISQFVYGVSTINQAFLFGGPSLATSLVERIMNKRVSSYCVFDKNAVLNLASSIKNLKIKLDEKAASALGVSPGEQRLAGEAIASFLKPGISGQDDSRSRQIQLIRAIFEALRSKNLIISSMLAQQVVANIETNFTSSEILHYHNRFTEQQGWTLKEHHLPGKTKKKGDKSSFEINLDKCRSIFK